MTRVALVTNLCTHYRKPLFARLQERFDIDFFFTSSGDDRYWSSDHTLDAGGLRVRPASPRRRLYDGIRDGGYECVITSLTGRLSLAAAVTATRRAHVPLVVWSGLWGHPRTPFHAVSRPFVRKLYRDADAVLVYGDHVARHIAAETGRTERVFHAYQSVDGQRYARCNGAERTEERELVAGFVGRLEPEKGVATLVDAIAISSTPARAVVIGSGRDEDRLKRLAAARGVSNRIEFTGYVPQSQLPARMRELDVVVVPSVPTRTHLEPWGLVVNEAMHAGVPVIASDAVGAVAGGLVTDGGTGFVFDAGDAVALADMLALASDPDLRQRIAAAGSRRVGAWNYDAAADAFVDAVSAAQERADRT